MPARAWNGYERFCPLSSALDIIGDRWTMVILQELLSEPLRYSDLRNRLPGIGSNVLSERLKRLINAGLLRQIANGPGEATFYHPTDEAQDLHPVFAEMRRWGVRRQLRSAAKAAKVYDVSFSVPAGMPTECYEWRIDDLVLTLEISGTRLQQQEGAAQNPSVMLTTNHDFMDRWAAGEVTWDAGVESGDVTIVGDADAWDRMKAATGYRVRLDRSA